MLRTVYTFFTGVLIATFIGVGVAAFYPAPTPPEYPTEIEYRDPAKEETSEQRELRKAHDAALKAHQEAYQAYARNASMIVLGCAVALVALGIIFASRLQILADGTLLGGLLSLLYSVILGFATQDNRYRFIVVAAGLMVALVLGYLYFVRPTQRTRNRK